MLLFHFLTIRTRKPPLLCTGHEWDRGTSSFLGCRHRSSTTLRPESFRHLRIHEIIISPKYIKQRNNKLILIRPQSDNFPLASTYKYDKWTNDSIQIRSSKESRNQVKATSLSYRRRQLTSEMSEERRTQYLFEWWYNVKQQKATTPKNEK